MGMDISLTAQATSAQGRTDENIQNVLGGAVPTDHSRQMNAETVAAEAVAQQGASIRVLDLGCGDGNSIDLFRGLNATVVWTGVDISVSPETARRSRTDGDFRVFDGINLPFDRDSFDIIYSKQVLEHVRHPAPLLQEVCRVLKPGGSFIGSTSHLEAYHSFSYWNYTPYGFLRLLEEAELAPLELRPGIDALTLITYRGLRCPRFFGRWWAHESPLNRCISIAGRLRGLDHGRINSVKLLFCGQFCFRATKA